MATLQAPLDLSSATRVGPRTYRKQVLAKRGIDYPMPDGSTRRVEFDDEYLHDLAAAYMDGAYDLVPFQLATPANEHNEDPRNYGGRVIGAEVTDDGLDLILELSEEADELVQRTGGKLGVSARIKPVRHVDGRVFKRAIRHVLGTLDPRMQNLRPWEPVVDLATDADDGPVIDLTRYTYTQEGATMPRIIDLSQLDPETLEKLETVTALEGIDLSAAEVDDEPDVQPADDEPAEDADDEPEDTDDDDEQDDEPEGITDDDLEALIDAELAGMSLSDEAGDDPEQIDLADDTDDVVPDVHVRLADAQFKLAAQDYARKGVPPHLIELAAPVLTLTDDQADSLDLSSPVTGEPINVRGIVRDMLESVAGTIDLSSEAGYGHETQGEQQVTDRAAAWIDYLENN